MPCIRIPVIENGNSGRPKCVMSPVVPAVGWPTIVPKP